MLQYHLAPQDGDREPPMSHHYTCGTQKAHNPPISLTDFISFSLKQKMIASQQAFSSKPSH